MTKLCYLLCLLVWCTSSTLSAQDKANVSGRVVDKTTKEALPFSTVMVTPQNKTNQPFGTLTQENGRFILSEVPKGSYKIKISYLGYVPKEINLLIGNLNQNFDLGRVELAPNVTALNEIVVEAQRQTVASALDKKSFNINDNLSQSGGSALEAMRNLPGVTIDQEGKVLLRGSDKVTVLIDGKQSSLTGFGNQKGLDNIPASNIERIEIINNPSAKYDSKGMAGIVNIIYKKEKRAGINGDASFHFGLGELSDRKSNLPDIMDKYSFTPKYNPSISLNYHTKKLNVFLQSEGMFRKKVNSNAFTTRTYDNQETPSEISQFLENRTQQLYNIKAGVDWYINANNTLTVYGLLEDEYHIDRGHVPYDYLTDSRRKRFWTWAEDENTRYLNYGMNYKHSFIQPGHQIEASFLYTHGKEDELFPFTDASATRNSTDSTHLITKEKVANFSLDYVKPFRTGRLEAGSKIQFRNIPISYKILPGTGSILDTKLGEWSSYKENIYAFYLNYVLESRFIDIEGGMRVESSSVKYNIDPNNQYYRKNESYSDFSFFPNVRFTYKINQRNKLSLFYNRRVDRPGEFELRPFPKYDDPEILKTGNPYLRPQYTQVFEAAYKLNWNTGSVYLAGYYKHIKDLFTRIYTQSESHPDIVNSIPQNLGKGKNIGMEIVAEQQLTSYWKADASFNWYQNTINSFTGTAIYPSPQSFSFEKSKSDTWNLKLNTSLNLPKEFTLQGTFVYYAPDIIPQGKAKSRSSLDLGIRKKAFQDKMEFTLAATDIFNKFSIRQEIKGDGFNLKSENYYETQTITLGVKYKF